MIPLSVPEISGEEWAYVKKCLDTNFVSSVGPFVGEFERSFAEFTGSPHAVACASGTAAIHLALRMAGVGPDDEVLVSGFTFVATINPIIYQGAAPILVDAEDRTWNIDPALVIEELERRHARGLKQPKAIVVAHILGAPADIAPIIETCQRFSVTVIEDAAEALGASYLSGPYAGRQVGTIGEFGCFSFNGNKVITTGGGGMLVTGNAAAARRAKHLSTQAKIDGPEYLHDAIGYNYRLTNIAAALGVAQLERLPEFLQRKAGIAAKYNAALGAVPGVTLPPTVPWAKSTFWLYSILIDKSIAGTDRKTVLEALDAEGIQARPVWAPAHSMPIYSEYSRLGGEVGLRLFSQGLSLPCSAGLTVSDQDRVIEVLVKALKRA